MAVSAILPLVLFFSPGKSSGAFVPFQAFYDFPVPDDWILQAPARLADPFRRPQLDFEGEVFGADIKGPLEASPAAQNAAAPAVNAYGYGNSVSAVLSGSNGPERQPGVPGRQKFSWPGGQKKAFPDRTSLWLEKDATNGSPGTPPDYDHGAGGYVAGAAGPDSGGGASQKTWKPSDEDTVFYSLAGNYDFPYGRRMDEGTETYGFNTSWKYETTRLAPVVMDAQATDAYLPGNTMPIGFQLAARAGIQKATISGSYGMNTSSMDFDSMTPVVHQFSGNLGYKLTPRVDVTGEVTYMVSDFIPNDGHIYQGGLNWRPSAADMIASSVKLMDSGPGQSYELFTGYQRNLMSSGRLSFNSDFSQDLYHFIHENLTLAYAWRWGKYVLNAAFGATMNEEPDMGGMLAGKTCTVGITRTFGMPIAGIF